MAQIAKPSAGNDTAADQPVKINRKVVFSWAMWDWATQPYQTVLLTFIWVSLYLVSDAFLPADIAALNADKSLNCAGSDTGSVYCKALADLSVDYGLVTFIAGLVVLFLAPALGQQTDLRGQKKKWVVAGTAALVVLQFLLFFVQADPVFFWFGAITIALGAVASEIAGASYNAMLFTVSTPKTIGRVSGLGWGCGYLGGILAMIIVVVITQLQWFGLDVSSGLAYRLIALGAAVWTIIFAVPFVLFVPETAAANDRARVGFWQSYVVVVRDLIDLYKHKRSAFWFLISSAIYRDGLVGIFSFGAILATVTFGFSATEVMIFGIALNLVAGVSTILLGMLDDRLGPRAVIIAALLVLLVCLGTIFVLHDAGKTVFWVCGLVLSATVGPAQSASRSLLARITPAHSQGQIFGLYATTGRAVSFLAPAAWALTVGIFGAVHFGALGVGLVVLLGLVLLVYLVPAASDVRE